MKTLWIADDGEGTLASRSDWVLLTDEPSAARAPRLAEAAQPIAQRPDWRLWTDDFNNLVQVLK